MEDKDCWVDYYPENLYRMLINVFYFLYLINIVGSGFVMNGFTLFYNVNIYFCGGRSIILLVVVG